MSRFLILLQIFAIFCIKNNHWNHCFSIYSKFRHIAFWNIKFLMKFFVFSLFYQFFSIFLIFHMISIKFIITIKSTSTFQHDSFFVSIHHHNLISQRSSNIKFTKRIVNWWYLSTIKTKFCVNFFREKLTFWKCLIFI